MNEITMKTITIPEVTTKKVVIEVPAMGKAINNYQAAINNVIDNIEVVHKEVVLYRNTIPEQIGAYLKEFVSELEKANINDTKMQAIFRNSVYYNVPNSEYGGRFSWEYTPQNQKYVFEWNYKRYDTRYPVMSITIDKNKEIIINTNYSYFDNQQLAGIAESWKEDKGIMAGCVTAALKSELDRQIRKRDKEVEYANSLLNFQI